jgi:hypothetical protein
MSYAREACLITRDNKLCHKSFSGGWLSLPLQILKSGRHIFLACPACPDPAPAGRAPVVSVAEPFCVQATPAGPARDAALAVSEQGGSQPASTVVLREMNPLTYRPGRAHPADCNCGQRARQHAVSRAPGAPNDRSCRTDPLCDSVRRQPDGSIGCGSRPQHYEEGQKYVFIEFPPPCPPPRGRHPHRPPFFCAGLFFSETNTLKRQFDRARFPVQPGILAHSAARAIGGQRSRPHAQRRQGRRHIAQRSAAARAILRGHFLDADPVATLVAFGVDTLNGPTRQVLHRFPPEPRAGQSPPLEQTQPVGAKSWADSLRNL